VAVTAKWYGQAELGLLSATASRKVDWASDTIKAAALKNTYTPDQDNHVFWSDVSAQEISASGGYTAGGVALAGKAVSYDAASNETRLTANPTTITAANATVRYIAVYKDTGTAGTSELLGYVDLGVDVNVVNTLTLNWDATGVLKAVAS
jgi:hypothetical protein